MRLVGDFTAIFWAEKGKHVRIIEPAFVCWPERRIFVHLRLRWFLRFNAVLPSHRGCTC